jgi:hypothetical protein
MRLVNGIDPGVSKTQPLATFLHRSAVIALRGIASSLSRGYKRTPKGKLKLKTIDIGSKCVLSLSINWM